MNFNSLSNKIGKYLQTISPKWDSRKAVLKLSEECYPGWEQSEWMDFYFRYLSEKYLPEEIPMNEKVCGTTFFDGIQDFSPDFKAENQQNVSESKEKKSFLTKKDFDLAYYNYQHWRQMEWIESYFNYLCEKKLFGILQMPGPVYQKFSFSGFLEIPWIFRAYIENTGNKKIILADADLITCGLNDFEKIGIILATGIVEYPKKEISVNNINNYKEQNQYELIMKKEMRQHSVFQLKHIYFIPLSSELIQKCKTFQPGGSKNREHLREKVLLNVSEVKTKQQFSIDFSE